MSAQWYLENRLNEQKEYYDCNATRHENAVARLRNLSFGAAIVAAVLGVSATSFDASWLSPWIGVITTLGTSITAYGLMERRQYLAATYGAMASSLLRIEEEFGANLADLVNATEHLLQGEHVAWIERMTKTIPTPLSHRLQRTLAVELVARGYVECKAGPRSP